MAAKERSHTEKLEKILDFLGDHIRSARAEELIETAREQGRDPGEENTRLKGILLRQLKIHQQKKLAQAREGYKCELASMSQRQFNLPASPEERRVLFMSTLAHSQFQPAFTLQHRDLSEFSDDDIEANLRKFAQLGLLPNISCRGEK